MHKIITSDFEIDLSNYALSTHEENSWFSDTFFTKYSYPFDLIITNEINKALGDLLSYDSRSAKYYLECIYVRNEVMENALLIFEQIKSHTASVTLKYGMDSFPNFDKYLNELNLEKKIVSNIYLDAGQVLFKSYPDTNYNFPQIHTNKYDPNSPQYYGFEKIINNRKNGGFIMNSVETINNEDVMFNRNIIQPLPYLMYVLTQGFMSSGRILKGDILDDIKLKELLFYVEREPEGQRDITPINLSFTNSDITSQTRKYTIPSYWTAIDVTQYIIIERITINQPGKYNIIGNIDIRTANYNYEARFNIYKDGVLIFSKKTKWQPWETIVDVDFIHHSGDCEIMVEVWSLVEDPQTVFDLQILPLYFIDNDGYKETNLLIDNSIDLNKWVPNITFGTLVNSICTTFNYDIDYVTDTEVIMNKINNSMKNNEIIDFSKFENIDVIRKPKTNNSFLLKFDTENENDLGSFYIDNEKMEFVNNDFKKVVDNTITFPILPLKNELIDNVFTAKSLESAIDKIVVVQFNGLANFNSNNYTTDSTILIENIIEEYYIDWLKNRVNAVEYQMTFIASANQISNLSTKKRIYCYNNIHLIKNIAENQLANEMFEVEIETETLIEL